MKVAYFDCASGISGDMALGALVDAGVSLDAIQAGIDSLGLPDCRLEKEEVHRKGFRATKIHVRHQPEHTHRHLHHITDMIDASELTDEQKVLARRIFTKLGEAEAHVHGTTLERVHFHEVGAVDSIADIVGVAIGWNLLEAETLICSPVPTGQGFIEIAHGRSSIPAPATAELLKGVPLATSVVEAELTTPTGAAIIATLASQFGPLPPLTIRSIGYGAGDKDFAQQGNILRLLIGDLLTPSENLEFDRVVVMETNLDDVTAEIIAFCASRLMSAGALDVFTTPVQMKKSRNGIKLSVICEPTLRSSLEKIIFEETGTLGIRRAEFDRTKQIRSLVTVTTPWGEVSGKQVTLPSGIRRFAPEFDACREIAEQFAIGINQVYEAARAAYHHPRDE